MAETYWQKLAGTLYGHDPGEWARILEEELSGIVGAAQAVLQVQRGTSGRLILELSDEEALRSALAERGLR